MKSDQVVRFAVVQILDKSGRIEKYMGGGMPLEEARGCAKALKVLGKNASVVPVEIPLPVGVFPTHEPLIVNVPCYN